MTNEQVRVYVGNLSSSATEDDLKATFGQVEVVQLIKSKGKENCFGFVSFKNQQDAEQAIQDWNEKEVNGNVLVVDFARNTRPRKKFPRKSASKKKSPEEVTSAPVEKAVKVEEKPKKAEEKPKKVENKNAETKAAKEEGKQKKQENKTVKQEGEKVEVKPKKQSINTVFVSNLPFKTTEEELVQEFENKGLKVVSAHIASKRVFQKGGEDKKKIFKLRSKGFGFVELSNAQEQQKAVELFKDWTLEERQVMVVIAHEKQEQN